jgi:hypothetical protein
MAITFNADVNSLVSDLVQLSCPVEHVRTLRGAPGRNVDVTLRNGVVISWDRFSRSIWVSGPYPHARRLERLLSLYYAGPKPFRSGLHLWRLGRARALNFLSKAATLSSRIKIHLQPSA